MKPASPNTLTPNRRRYIWCTLFITGAAALTLEILGARLISPYYGSSLYTWSALITVTLIALAGGYNWGGKQADRHPTLPHLAKLVGWAGIMTALIPFMREPALQLTTPLGLQLGSLVSATVLLAPSLLLLGTVGPLAIRLTTGELCEVGRGAGDAYAVSTLGSVLGATLTGFVLVPHFALSRLLYGLSAVLLLVAAIGYYLSLQRLPLPSTAAAAIVCALSAWPHSLPNTNVLLNRESAYGQIKVLDAYNKRYLLVNGTAQSVMDLNSGESQAQYEHSIEWAALIRPQAKNALVLGVGAGLLPTALERYYGLSIDMVDIDPAIIETAQEYFGFHPRHTPHIGDGRAFLSNTGGKRYDLIFLDAFGSELPPYHLFTREAFEAMRSTLRPGGALAINFISLVRPPGNEPWLSTYKTLASVFPNVRAFLASDTYDGIGNILFFASDDALNDSGAAAHARSSIQADMRALLNLELKPEFAALARAPSLSDDYAPLEFLLARTSQKWRPLLQKQIASVLLY